MKASYFYVWIWAFILWFGGWLIWVWNPDILDGLKSAITGTSKITPTISLVANPQSVNYNSSSTITWTTSNMQYCTLKTGSADEYAASKAPLSGTKVVGPLIANRTITLNCTGKNGKAYNASQTINVIPLPIPSVSIVASSTNITSGSQTYISWNSSNATACTFVEWDSLFKNQENTLSWSNRPTEPLFATQNYTINCTNWVNSSTGSVTINVSSPTSSGTTIPEVQNSESTSSGVTTSGSTLSGTLTGSGM